MERTPQLDQLTVQPVSVPASVLQIADRLCLLALQFGNAGLCLETPFGGIGVRLDSQIQVALKTADLHVQFANTVLVVVH